MIVFGWSTKPLHRCKPRHQPHYGESTLCPVCKRRWTSLSNFVTYVWVNKGFDPAAEEWSTGQFIPVTECEACGHPHADRYGALVNSAYETRRALAEIVRYFDEGHRMPPAGFPLASVIKPALRRVTAVLDACEVDAPKRSSEQHADSDPSAPQNQTRNSAPSGGDSSSSAAPTTEGGLS